MALPLVKALNLSEALSLSLEHRPDQIANALRYRWHALRGFPVARLPYDPVRLNLFITPRCNLRCAYCQFHSPAASGEMQRTPDMALETVRQVLDRFRLAVSVCLGGAGEPLLHPDVFEMLRLVHRRHMRSVLVTNGTLLPGKMESVLRAPVDFMNVSFYGVDEETFARRTGARPALFDGMLRAVAELVRRRKGRRGPGRLRASFVCTRENFDQALAFVALCDGLGIDEAKLASLTDYRLTEDGRPLALEEDDPAAQAFVARLKRMRHRVRLALPRLLRRDYVSRRCHLPFKEISVGADSGTAPCCAQAPFVDRTNVFTDPHAWNAPALLARRRALINSARPLPAVCRQCEKLVRISPRPGGTPPAPARTPPGPARSGSDRRASAG